MAAAVAVAAAVMCRASVQECGTDALRFALCAYTAQGRDINLDIKRVVAYRHWCNKLWNAIKFGMLTLGDAFAPAADSKAGLACPPAAADAAVACRWLLSRLHAAADAANAGFEAYEFATTTQAIYAFWQYDVCDTFIEVAKPIVRARPLPVPTSIQPPPSCPHAAFICMRSVRLCHAACIR